MSSCWNWLLRSCPHEFPDACAAPIDHVSSWPRVVKGNPAPFAQILGKLYFLQLSENLRRILLDYGQKQPRPANAAFNAAC
jgi:hypothetical protein